MANIPSANGEVLDQLQKELDELLEDETKSTKELVRGLIRSNLLVFPYIRQSQNDHKRLDSIWLSYRLSNWVLGIVGSFLLFMLWKIFTGEINLTFIH